MFNFTFTALRKMQMDGWLKFKNNISNRNAPTFRLQVTSCKLLFSLYNQRSIGYVSGLLKIISIVH